MPGNILDDSQENQDRLKYSQTFIFIWLLYAIASIYFGLSFIYQYSDSGLLWVIMLHISSAYALIITGIVGLFINKRIRNNEKELEVCILIFIGITFFFYLGNCIQVGVEGSVNSYDYLLELLNLNYIINIILALVTYGNIYERKSLKEIVGARKKSFLWILVGLLPAILAQLIDYDFFSFLHT